MEDAELRRHGDLVQDAVDAVADAQIVLQRLDVNVGGALDDGFADDWLTNLTTLASGSSALMSVLAGPRGSKARLVLRISSKVSAPTP